MTNKKIIGISISSLLAIIILSVSVSWCKRVVNPDKAVSTYENFYILYDQADQICSDIKVMNQADSISGGFSKVERVIALENKLNEVIKEYNSKSKAWTRNMWKPSDLPHQLKRSNFNCNN